MSTFSPGPWTVKGNGSEGWRDVVDSRDGIVALVDVRLAADAHLIAAARGMHELIRRQCTRGEQLTWDEFIATGRTLLEQIDENIDKDPHAPR